MSKWNKLTLTNAGLQLLANAQNGSPLVITHIELGDGVLPANFDVKAMTKLTVTKQVLEIGEYEVLPGGKLRINSAITNEGLSDGYYIRQLGVFARGASGNPQLYMMATDNAPDFLSEEDGTVITQEFDVYLTTAGATNLVVETSAANIVTFGNLKREVKKAMAGIEFVIDKTDNGLNLVYGDDEL